MIVRAHHHLSILIAVLSVALATLAIVAAPASAATASTTRSITASSPTSGVPGPPGSICAPGASSHYAVVQFQLDVVANDTVSITVTPSGFKATAAIFAPAYLPSAPTADCYDDATTGASSGAPVTLSTYWGAIGSTPLHYYMQVVVWGATSSDLGTFDVSITTSGANLTIDPAPSSTDTTPPTVTVPSPITREATSSSGGIVTYSAAANDDTDGALTPTCVPASGSTFPLGTTTVHCSATDAAGNTGTNSFTVTVSDATAPVFSAVSNKNAEATSASGAAVTYAAPTATDAVDGSRPVSCLPASGSTFALGATSVTCTASDTSGHTATTGFTVTVADTTAPALSLPTVPATEATSASGAVVTYAAPTALDAVDGSVPVDCDHATGDTFPLGSTTVHCSVTDAHHNTATGSFSVVVHDTTAPDIATITDVTAEAADPTGATVTYATPTATDAVDGTDTVSCLPASGTTFAIGSTTVTCTSTDAAGNIGTRAFHVIVKDTSAPVLVLPADIVAEATGPSGATVDYPAPSAHDTVDGDRPVTCSTASGSSFALGSTTVTCSASDTAGNTASGSFHVTVRDTTPPALHTPGVAQPAGGAAVPATSRAGAVVTYAVTAADVVDSTDKVTCSPASGSTFPIGTTTVTCHATDAAGNTGTSTFVVTVAAIRDPHITAALSSPVPPGATGWYRAPVTVAFTCTPGTAPVVSCPAPITLRSQGSRDVTRHVDATDTGSASVTVSVRIDRRPPSIRLRPGSNAAGFTCHARDALSGVHSCRVQRARGGRWVAVATDNAGNTARRSTRLAIGTSYFLDVPVQGGRALVHAGSSYQLRVYDPLGTPRYLNAARDGADPTAPTTPFRVIGGGWWTLGISIDPAMAGHDWVVGIEVGRQVKQVRLRVLP